MAIPMSCYKSDRLRIDNQKVINKFKENIKSYKKGRVEKLKNFYRISHWVT